MTIDLTINNEDIIMQIKMLQMGPGINEQILTRRIIENEAEKAGIRIEVSELQKAADDFRVQYKLTSTKSTEQY
jgi:hypothetical protein